jgi:spore maturation protein SpmA
MLHKIWLSFFVIGFVSALYQWLGVGDSYVFQRIIKSSFDMASLSVELSIGLIGVLSFWLGITALGEASGLMAKLASMLSPLFSRLMPEVPRGHPAIGSMTLNLSANVLGLDNAATPLGLKAMRDLQTLNPRPDTATNAQILFLVLNTSSVTLFPITVLLYRAQMGAVDPASVFIPILIATSCSTLAGLLVTAWVQKLKLWDAVVMAYLALAVGTLFSIIAYFSMLGVDQLQQQSSLISNFMILSVIMLFLLFAHFKKVNVYEKFIEGAKTGFQVAIDIIPFMLAMLVAIGVFRASGALGIIINFIRDIVLLLGMDTRFVDVLPTAFMKPLSGSGARAMMVETMNTHGVDSFQGLLAATIQGSTETTFYVLAVYFGSVGIRHGRHALACGLTADVVGVISAISLAYWFYG